VDVGRLHQAKAKYESVGEKFPFTDHQAYGKTIKDSLLIF